MHFLPLLLGGVSATFAQLNSESRPWRDRCSTASTAGAREAEFRSMRVKLATAAHSRPESVALRAYRNRSLNVKGLQPPVAYVNKGQTASPELDAMLRLDSGRPVWDSAFVSAMRRRARAGNSLSPAAYPHAAEDLSRACAQFVTGQHRSSALRFAVASSLSPWVELTLMRDCGATNITTLEFNEPIISDAKLSRSVSSLAVAALPSLYAQQGPLFDVIVSFSGIEHDGLGRYGDPLNIDGDLAATAELRCLLRPGGLLLLGVPTHCREDDGTIHQPRYMARVYGPQRLPRLLAGFELLGWAWQGQLVPGGLEAAAAFLPHNLSNASTSAMRSWLSFWYDIKRSVSRRPWMHQPLLVLTPSTHATAEQPAPTGSQCHGRSLSSHAQIKIDLPIHLV